MSQNQIVLELNRSFYPKSAVLQAIEDFSDSCNISARETEKTFIISLDSEEAKQAFSNYVLGLSKKARSKKWGD